MSRTVKAGVLAVGILGLHSPGAACRYRGCPTSPSRWASALASPRVRTFSFRRMAPTWCPTVRSESTSRPAMSALRSPSAISASTSSSRLVRPAGFCCVFGRGALPDRDGVRGLGAHQAWALLTPTTGCKGPHETRRRQTLQDPVEPHESRARVLGADFGGAAQRRHRRTAGALRADGRTARQDRRWTPPRTRSERLRLAQVRLSPAVSFHEIAPDELARL